MEKNTEGGASEWPEPETAGVTPGLAEDRLYRMLAARPRRRLLYYLKDVERATVGDLAAVLVGWDRSEQGGMATRDDYDRVAVTLRHTHLPALDDTGLLTYDPDTDEVTARQLGEGVSDLLARSIAAETE